MTPIEALTAVRQRHALDFRLDGPCAGGEVGAHYAISPGGDRVVFKWTEDTRNLAMLKRAVRRVESLRRKSYPAPRYHPPLEVEGGVVIFQDLMPGACSDSLSPELVDSLLELNDLQAGEGDPGDNWSAYITQTLVHGATGYCEHDSLANHSESTRAVLRWVRGLGATLPRLPANDLVHIDFHHRNVLQDQSGVLTAVIDWEGIRPGDRAFDLITLWFGMTHAATDAGIEERIWERASSLTNDGALAAYVAHMSLRRLDWSIRNHDATDLRPVLEFVDLARTRLGLRPL